MEKAVLITAFAGRFAASAFLAFTTSLVVYPTFASFAAELLPGWGHFCGVFASVIIFMALDGTLSKLLPYNMHKLVNLEFKGGSKAVEFGIVTILTYSLLAGTMLSSYWANPLISQRVFGDADKGLIEQAQNEDTKAAQSIDLYSIEFQSAKDKLLKAETKAAQLVESAIVSHSSKAVQRNMRKGVSGWYATTPKLATYRAKVVRARTKGEKGVLLAQKDFDAAIVKRNAYIEKKEGASESTKAELLAIYQNEQATKDKLKGNSNNVLLLLDLSTGSLMTLLSLIIALMIKNNPGVKVPEAGSITEVLFKVIMSVKKIVIVGLEYLTRSDLNGDGFIGEKKTENQVGEPIPIKAVGSDLELLKRVEASEAKAENLAMKFDEIEREKEVTKKIKLSQTKKQNLAKNENAKKIKPNSENPFSLNGSKGKLAKVSETKGFENLAKKLQKDLLSSEKLILKVAKVSVAKKHYDNAILAVKKAKKSETVNKAKVKALWLAKILGINDKLN